MDEAIENAAKALYADAIALFAGIDLNSLWANEDEHIRKHYREEARIVIDALAASGFVLVPKA